MVKNNIQIKVGNSFIDYDDDTAIGITFRAFDFTNIDSFFVNSTNNFSLPITPNNRKVFDFSESTNSNPAFPYEIKNASIYVDGVLTMSGTFYIENISGGRYNIIFTEDKEIFTKLKELKFCAPRVGDEYEDSLMFRIISYWNSTVKNSIRTQYNPSGTQQWLDAVYNYVLQKGVQNSRGEYSPANDFCIPFTMNCFSQQIPYAKSDDNEVAVRDNPITTSDYDITYGYGLQLARKIVTIDENGNYSRNGKFDVSPLWASVDLIISLLEEYTDFEFVNLSNIINEYTGTGNRSFIHLPGVEFDMILQQTGDGHYTLNFDGTTSLINIGENKDYTFYGGTVSDIGNDSFISSNCLDFIKMLMREFNLVMNLNIQDKKLIFRKFSDVKNTASTRLYTISENEKKFKIDGIKQKQCINYEGDAVNKKYVLDCANKTIDAGSYDDALFTINRYMYSEESYALTSYISFGRRKKVYLDAPNFTINDVQKGFIMAIPTAVQYGKYDVSKVGIAGSVFQFGDANNGNLAYYADFGDERQFQILIQNFCGSYGQYDYLSSMIEYPQTLDVTVKKDLNFLHNFDRINSISLEGYTGKYYVQEISKYNPRVDDTLALKLVKLPVDVIVDTVIE